ncbi:MAG: hypothetical protein KatS3mg011_2277 [Acidimicrobiia bacterium]|nr:MAG: hypothetical protein KatS3mg011_2277 [Acidimicrobiia bacterium]
MRQITVFVPVPGEAPARRLELALRRSLPANPVLTVVENGKPKARDLLIYIVEELSPRLPGVTLEVYSKASAGKPLEGEEARRIAARSHLILTGVGD